MNDVYILPKQLGEKVAKLHFPLTVFIQEQAVPIFSGATLMSLATAVLKFSSQD